MKNSSILQPLKIVASRLCELLGLASSDAVMRTEVPGRVDAVVDLAGFTFVITWRGSGAAAPVHTAAVDARSTAAALGPRAIPLVAVPFMGAAGQERCARAEVAWVDLSGNARIFAPGIRVNIDGQPNRFKRRGRPSSAFAPKSARIARWLLMNPETPATQREIALATQMDEGFTSRIVSRLEADKLVVRDEHGAIHAHDPELLLDAWREDYDFEKHRILRGHIAARTGDALLRSVAEVLDEMNVEYAATGLAGAWLLTQFAGFRTATLYVSEPVSTHLKSRLNFREDARGANLWLVSPNDEGVFQGSSKREGVCCAHPIQTYLDLTAHPERAAEAATELRRTLLNWKTHDGQANHG